MTQRKKTLFCRIVDTKIEGLVLFLVLKISLVILLNIGKNREKFLWNENSFMVELIVYSFTWRQNNSKEMNTQNSYNTVSWARIFWEYPLQSDKTPSHSLKRILIMTRSCIWWVKEPPPHINYISAKTLVVLGMMSKLHEILVLEIWRVWNLLSLPILPRMVVVPVRIPSVNEIDRIKKYSYSIRPNIK